MNRQVFYKLKPEHDGTEYPWPNKFDPDRTLELFADDVLTKAPEGCVAPMKPGTFMKHTGLGCFNIEIPDDHLDMYEGWPAMELNGRPYGHYEKPRKVSA